MRHLVTITLLAALSQAQDLERVCLPGNDLANGLALQVDGFGRMHLARVARVSGNLLYTVVPADGVHVDETVETRISLLAQDEVEDLGLVVEHPEAHICYYDAAEKRFKVASRDAEGAWSASVVAAGDGVGRHCDLVRYKGDLFVAWSEGGALKVATQRNGAWTPLVADAPAGRQVGRWPSIAVGPQNQLAVAHLDETRGELRISWLDGVWQSTGVPFGALDAGWRPSAFYSAAGELFVYHGGVPDQPDLGADVALIEVRGVPGAGFRSGQLPGFSVGGSLDTASGGGLTTLFVRERQRSALFGDADGLYLHRGATGEALEVTVLEQGGPQDQRHGYHYLQAAHDPFLLPVLAFLDDAAAFFNQPPSARLCYYRPRDSDGDALPDEIEDSLGTDPDVADTDEDGRTDGEEVLIDGTDPGGGPDCVPSPETCDGTDEDCDGRIDEGVTRACYPADPATRGVGLCREGVETCVAGEFGACQGAVVPRPETCDRRDEDCDGLVDVDPVGAGDPCSTGGVGACDPGTRRCRNGALVCEALQGPVDEVCNLEDDDCDGLVDEGRVECGLGRCHVEQDRCANGEEQVCVPAPLQRPDTECDNVDDDCDGVVDEGVVAEPTRCGVGACERAGVNQCVEGGFVDTCRPGEPAANDATCDGVDDDCDGTADEDFPEGVIHCGIGACRAQGQGRCVDGQEVGECTPGQPGVEGAACDGVDQDCDGRADEDFVPEIVPCGVGACVAAGHSTCVDGELGSDCRPLNPGPNDATCDQVDDDCDGSVDEDFRGRPVNCGEGACAAVGEVRCVDGEEVPFCQPGEPGGGDATCDGRDDDCDGTADEDFVGEPVACGVGACAAEGVTRCVGGEVVADCVPADSQRPDDDCDGVDDDCDGVADEAHVPVPTRCGVGACKAEGALRCVNGALVDDCDPGAPAVDDDTCDDVDDDCDGAPDEDFVPLPSRCGVGACASEGVASCVGGRIVDSCEPGQPAVSDASCNAVDDDCDGVADEDFRSRQTICGIGACGALGDTECIDGVVRDTCVAGEPQAVDDAMCDGVDSDCDGLDDEDYVAPETGCGIGACARTGELRCVLGAPEDTCTPGLAAPNDRACDGVDSDCDGVADEDYLPQETSCGVGACAAEGATFCQDGAIRDSCQPGEPAADDATCDGVDDDCDGVADEDYPVSDTSCGVGACAAAGQLVCRSGQEVDTCEPGVPGPDDRVCDGVDSDCDGEPDEDYQPEDTGCGVGACEAQGVTVCVDGEVQDTCVPGEPAPDDATCDGVDDDCDDVDDEDYVGATTDCGVGACAAEGVFVCVLGVVQDTCVPLDQLAADDVTCDARDDDCDGSVDEDFAPTPTGCGEGACAAVGQVICDDGAPRDTCRPRRPALSDATCDGFDDDCDGEVDESYQPRGVRCGLGVCVAEGVTACELGVETSDCAPGEPTGDDTECDDVDQDCDGTPDDGFPVEETRCGVGDCVAVGQRVCEFGVVRDTCEGGPAALTDATCDGRDDDCDEQVDEDYQPGPSECGVGACAAVGDRSCVEGEERDTCTPGVAAAADPTCDGADDDCDGDVDEDYPVVETRCGVGACGATGERVCRDGQPHDTCMPGRPALVDESCDGSDDDCDLLTDEDFQPFVERCGVGVCRAESQITCEGGIRQGGCEPNQPQGDDADCDGLDQDCDGTPDDGFQVEQTACGQGLCAATGQRVCRQGEVVDTCEPGRPGGPDANCDGVDDDCDGTADEGFEPLERTCGVGACRRAGLVGCQDGEEVFDCQPGEPAADDATCDGARDEDFEPPVIECGLGVCAAQGVQLCVGGNLVDDCDPQPGAESDDTCDGIDDDCDGAADEDFTGEVVCGVGACETVGEQVCDDGQVVERCFPANPTSDDNCDGVDDDCDGTADEDFEPGGVACGVGACVSRGVGVCVEGVLETDCVPGDPLAEDDATCDGVDDDCDGTADEDCPVPDAGADAAPIDPDDGVPPPDAGLRPDAAPVDPDDGVPPPDAAPVDPDDGVPPPDGSAMTDADDVGGARADARAPDAEPQRDAGEPRPDADRRPTDACVGAECPERPRVRKPVPEDPINCSSTPGQAPVGWALLLLLGAVRRRRR